MATGTNNKSKNNRKRVNRIKYLIVAFAVLLLVSSVVLNFVLMFKVLHLEQQIDQLYSFIQITNNILC